MENPRTITTSCYRTLPALFQPLRNRFTIRVFVGGSGNSPTSPGVNPAQLLDHSAARSASPPETWTKLVQNFVLSGGLLSFLFPQFLKRRLKYMKCYLKSTLIDYWKWSQRNLNNDNEEYFRDASTTGESSLSLKQYD